MGLDRGGHRGSLGPIQGPVPGRGRLQTPSRRQWSRRAGVGEPTPAGRRRLGVGGRLRQLGSCPTRPGGAAGPRNYGPGGGMVGTETVATSPGHGSIMT